MRGSPSRGANGVLGSCSGLTSPLHPGGPLHPALSSWRTPKARSGAFTDAPPAPR